MAAADVQECLALLRFTAQNSTFSAENFFAENLEDRIFIKLQLENINGIYQVLVPRGTGCTLIIIKD